MADLRYLDPDSGGETQKMNNLARLTHFAWRFPQNVMINNLRVDQGYTKFPHELLKRQNFSQEQLKKDNSLSVCIDIDEALIQNKITIGEIDYAISRFYSTSRRSLNPQDYKHFCELARPIYISLIDDKKHRLELLFS